MNWDHPAQREKTPVERPRFMVLFNIQFCTHKMWDAWRHAQECGTHRIPQPIQAGWRTMTRPIFTGIYSGKQPPGKPLRMCLVDEPQADQVSGMHRRGKSKPQEHKQMELSYPDKFRESIACDVPTAENPGEGPQGCNLNRSHWQWERIWAKVTFIPRGTSSLKSGMELSTSVWDYTFLVDISHPSNERSIFCLRPLFKLS